LDSRHERGDDALERNSTWEIVDKPRDYKIVGCKWVL